MAVGYAPDGLSLATVRYVTHGGGGGGPTAPGIVAVAAYDPAVMSAILQELDLSQGPGPLVGSKAWVRFNTFPPSFFYLHLTPNLTVGNVEPNLMSSSRETCPRPLRDPLRSGFGDPVALMRHHKCHKCHRA